jgi:hypothetical protein
MVDGYHGDLDPGAGKMFAPALSIINVLFLHCSGTYPLRTLPTLAFIWRSVASFVAVNSLWSLVLVMEDFWAYSAVYPMAYLLEI